MLEKLLELFGYEKCAINEEKTSLDDRLEIRLNKSEKILIQKYCLLKGTDPSKLIRKLINDDINSFIQQEADKNYRKYIG